MFSRLLNTRIRAAERALNEGRLDDAYRLVTQPEIAEHRCGQNLRASLARKLYERARAHFDDDRFTEALLDLNKAEVGGVMTARITELRDNIRIVADEAARRQRTRRARLEDARQRIHAGSLVAGRRILEGAAQGDAEAQELKREVAERLDRATTLFADAARLLGEGQLNEAIDRLRRARRLDPRSEQGALLESDITEKIVGRAREAFVAGQCRRAEAELSRLGELGASSPSRGEAERLISLLSSAATALHSGQYDQARQDALRLERSLPEAKWLRAAIDQLRDIDEQLLVLQASPLGELARGAAEPAKEDRAGQARIAVVDRSDPALAETLPYRAGPQAMTLLPDRLLLLVDGGGSFLLLRNDRVSIGRATSNDPADVPLLANLAERHAELARVEDNYFLFATRPVEVAGRKTSQQLLQDGDRVVLGRNGKFTFRVPSRKSASAILDLSDTTKMPNDVRRVVLLRHNVMLGTGSSAHVHCRGVERALVLFERAGGLWVRPEARGHAATEARPIRFGQTMEVAGASLVIKPWPTRPPGAIEA